MSKDILYLIDTGYACGGILVDEKDVVRKTCPIYKWMIGKPLEAVLSWKNIKTLEVVN